jgi:sarcosine oxidase, subunit beta
VNATRYPVVVLGAGICGTALAYHLTRRGVGPVLVYDPRTPAAGATGRAAGIVTEQLWDHWDVLVTRESHREYADLASRWDPTAYLQNGFVRWTRDPVAEPIVWETLQRLKSWGVEVEEATPSDLARWLPQGRFEDVRAAIMGRHDACVTPSAIATIYAEGARQAGATFDFGQSMESVSALPEGGYLLRTGGREFRADQLVVAAGAWSKRLLIELGHPIPLTPYRTQAALLRPPTLPADPFPSGHDIDLDVYVRPEGPDRILGGNGTERTETNPDNFKTGGDERFITHLAESLTQRFPGWADSELISSWAGVCSSTFDRRPLVGPVPNADGLFVTAGYNGFGVMRAGGAMRRLADLIAEGPESDAAREALRPVWPGRFPEHLPDFSPRPGFTLEGGDTPRF